MTSLRDLLRRLSSTLTNECPPARFVARVPAPRLSLDDGATVRLPSTQGRYVPLRPDIKARNRSEHRAAPRQSMRSAVGL